MISPEKDRADAPAEHPMPGVVEPGEKEHAHESR